ncbi:MAG: patatin-like phospholipase family protein [Geminicoccaceae bacterium]|nr:MAG: patatin-like phospholipase family protein [Geminicoccaceae bacterium]
MTKAHTRKTLNLALQGGGAHGAFAWGVLDALLADPRIAIEGISGTSAGAMNAAVVAYGLAKGGSEGARQALAEFWQGIAAVARFSPLQPTPLDRWLGHGNMEFSPGWVAFDAVSRMVSPYQFNPLDMNPLADVLCSVVDFEWLADRCAHDVVKLFLCASNVCSGKIKVFQREEISSRAVLASACLPFLFKAVEIDGEHYWDGGYMGNPPIFPLIYGVTCPDVLIVQLNPIALERVPTTPREIADRVNTLSFNSSLMREMRAIAFVTRLLDDGCRELEGYKRLNLHAVEAERIFRDLGVSSKLNADRAFLEWLFDLGQARGREWLDAHVDDIGVRTTLDLDRFL